MNTNDTIRKMLSRWMEHAEQYWFPIPGQPELGCYGSGYNSWGVQTNQKYVGAMAALAQQGDARARARALAALRFSLATHLTGETECTDGTRWGHTWISGLGIERMMFGVNLMEPHLAENDRAALRRVLVSEADWLLNGFANRSGSRGISAGQWNSSGKNEPESNLWNGALLWRTAAMYAEEPNAGAWRDKARAFLVNAVSVPADAANEARHVGANFFPHYALDHHGYMNVGYMVICVSNAAMLHFDLRALGREAPPELHHHQHELWDVLRRMIFTNGRLARIGGDSRQRYAYAQEYLLPALLYAGDALGDNRAFELADNLVGIMAAEFDFNGDGSFYGRRFAKLAESNPYYYTRLESDRADMLAMGMVYSQLARKQTAPAKGLKDDAGGTWCESEHGDVLHRSPGRIASFAWRAWGLAQGLCLPPGAGHLAEWSQNLCGIVRFPGEGPDDPPNRKLLSGNVAPFEGGFLAWGAITEGASVTLSEGWRGENLVAHQMVFAALPDNRTVVGIERMRSGSKRVYIHEVQGLHLNLANDLFNGFQRKLATGGGETSLHAPATAASLELDGNWTSVDECLAVLGLYGAGQLRVRRAERRRGGPGGSIYTEEIAWGGWLGTRAIAAETVFLDVGWAVACEGNRDLTAQWAQSNRSAHVETGAEDLKRVDLQGFDGRTYCILANFGNALETVTVPRGRDLVSGAIYGESDQAQLEPGTACVLVR